MNELQIIFLQKQQVKELPKEQPKEQDIKLVPDNHYGLLVTLMRSDRPRYWNFLCVNCGSKVAEIMNMEVEGLQDFFDPQNTANDAIARHCKGYLPKTGLPCGYKYFFHVR
jgi:hypothetical protein